MALLIQLIHLVARILILVVIVQAFMSFFVSPWHPIREKVDRFVNPLLAPIRRFVPAMGGLDFSPLIFIILVQLLESVITNILWNLA